MLRFNQLKDFTDRVEQQGHHLPFKVMGVRQQNEYFTLSLLRAVYEDIDDPDRVSPLNFPIPTLFGTIRRKGSALDPMTTYSKLTPPVKGPNLFQGDIIGLDLNTVLSAGAGVPPHRLSMIISHSCDIGNSATTLLAPVYEESQLTLPVLQGLKGAAVKNEAVTRVNWLQNESAKYVGFPEDPSVSPITERFLVPIGIVIPVPRDRVVAETPLVRLTYRALSYLQIRIAIALIRDVQYSDETRDF